MGEPRPHLKALDKIQRTAMPGLVEDDLFVVGHAEVWCYGTEGATLRRIAKETKGDGWKKSCSDRCYRR